MATVIVIHRFVNCDPWGVPVIRLGIHSWASLRSTRQPLTAPESNIDNITRHQPTHVEQKNASNPFVGSKQVSCCRICVIGAYSYLYDRGQLVIITRELATAKILTRTTYHRIKRTTLQDLRVAQLLATLTTTTLTPLHPTLLLLQLRATLCTGIPVIRLDNNSHHHNLKQLGFTPAWLNEPLATPLLAPGLAICFYNTHK